LGAKYTLEQKWCAERFNIPSAVLALELPLVTRLPNYSFRWPAEVRQCLVLGTVKALARDTTPNKNKLLEGVLMWQGDVRGEGDPSQWEV
jgi:hypothetical protein